MAPLILLAVFAQLHSRSVTGAVLSIRKVETQTSTIRQGEKQPIHVEQSILVEEPNIFTSQRQSGSQEDKIHFY